MSGDAQAGPGAGAWGGRVMRTVNTAVNAGVRPLLTSPLHRAVSGSIALVTYTGRRSGATFRTPVAYRRSGDEVRIRVAMPLEKSWWRNFEGDGAPVQLTLRGVDHQGHAVSSKDAKGRTWVTATLTD